MLKKNKQEQKNKCTAILLKIIKWLIPVVIVAVITAYAEVGAPILPKKLLHIPPSLDTSKSNIETYSIFYYAQIPKDTKNNFYLAFQTEQTGHISINLTNNDESTLVVNDIYLDVFDYQTLTDIILTEEIWGNGYSTPVYYGVQLENLCKEYKCMLLDKESAIEFSTYHTLPNGMYFKVMGEQIEHNKTDEIDIIFSSSSPGLYRFKIIIDYSIRNFNGRIESNEFVFISFDPNLVTQN